MKNAAYSPAKERAENENAMLDRDGFPPCLMTVDEFCNHVRETFAHPSHRIIAFRVRSYTGYSTLTTRRGEMPGTKATKVQIAAYRETTARPEISGQELP